VRDQNLVVWGKNYRLFGFVFFISFQKVLNEKAKWQREFVCIFYIKGKWTQSRIKVDLKFD